MKITILSGATRESSHSTSIAKRLEKKFYEIQEDLDVVLIDNRKLRLPVFDNFENLSNEEKDRLDAISKTLLSSDALVIVSPEYNGGIAGGLKNTLDYFRKEYEWRPMGLVSVTSGTLGGQNAMNQMAAFASYVGACLAPTRLMVSQVQEVVNLPHSAESMRFEKNAEKFCSDLLRFAQIIKNGMLNYSLVK
ncbi:MAG: NADPH-dependent FMN reductase [Thermaurantimonas sp.]|uniref:NADPH-dependent FMN reductase n=1 Tax=Thermaurantimonas sp. TaxID=2681568 RepID=UPI00391ACD87